MSDQTSPESNVPQGRPRPPPNRRRDKPQLSCDLCRRRKLKCNRLYPCENCAKRGLDSQCTFPGPATRSTARQRSRDANESSNVYDRLRQLESQLARIERPSPTPTRHVPGPAATPTESGTSTNVNTPSGADNNFPPEGLPFSGPTLQGPGSVYVDCSHWSSILRGVSELRPESCTRPQYSISSLSNEKDLQQPPGPLLLYGCRPVATKQELLDAIPPKAETDRLIAHYFNALDLSSAMLRRPGFAKEYGRFWDNPAGTPVLWLSLLFGMLCIAMQFRQGNPENTTCPEERSGESVAKYKEKVVQSLLLGRYTQGGPYVIEALVHYLAIEHLSRPDADSGVWIVVGILVNLAMRMGYHRDPSYFDGITPHDAEMRRRLWIAIYVLGCAISEHMGMPHLIKNVDDVKEPRNLLDTDFDEFTVELPPARSDKEPTPMLYCLAKFRSLKVSNLINDLVTSRQRYSYAEVMEVDAKLSEAHSNIPVCYKWRSLSESVTDPPIVICRRLYLEILHLKARIVLHIRHVLPTQHQQDFAYSRRVIADALCESMKFHHIMDEETRPTGQLFQSRWRFSAIVNQNFLLTTIAMCFFLRHNKSEIGRARLEEIKRLCRQSQGIWIRSSRTSKEASKAAEALKVLLDNWDNPVESARGAGAPVLKDPTLDSWASTTYSDVSGGLEMPFSYFSLFDELEMTSFASETPDHLLVPPVTGQSSDYLTSAQWYAHRQES
ncbi:hypothetical protein JX266_012866 [Neoarthrinium moseri]|uniref:uncharacterized protein n=1 Tax=Neoarthrinium moseri TaxID=1658444 RepID=UPI001FDCA80D|nr:uncharacterized protein JN550_003851 [Neoarthrinium moseri]KAI1840930.1 hypothetical protein JX266_012866 [Neoarthrinium moseri]KAI1872977.1 hypothetical protein JN550_003851 [Neoarthrinium moseri]